MQRRPARRRAWWTAAALTLTAGLAAACGTGNSGTASGSGGGSPSSFYSGQTLTVVVPYGPGGGYDQWARIMSPYLKKYLGVDEVKIQNVPGGGGLIGTNQVYSAKPDGLTIGDTNAGGDVFDQMDQADGYEADVTKMSWIGRPDDDPHVIATRDADHRTFDGLVSSTRQIKALATGKGSSDYNSAVIIYNAFHVPFQMVAAFSGSSEEKAAFLSGEGATASLSASDIAAIKGKASPVVVVSKQTFNKLPNTPTVIEEAKKHNLSADRIKALTALSDVMDLGHAFFAPPGVPADRLQALRTAFQKTMQDKDMLAAAEKAGLYAGFESGQDLTQAAKDALGQKALFTDLLKTSA
jgi:tripartite-type tricarboxylate transporter receptor subunit TctC